jgi:hypothetical protein
VDVRSGGESGGESGGIDIGKLPRYERDLRLNLAGAVARTEAHVGDGIWDSWRDSGTQLSKL